MDGQGYRGTGYFTGKDDNGYSPYPNTLDHDIFRKNERGLKIIIPYLRDEIDDEIAIVKAVSNNFFVAILDNKLEVYLDYNGKTIPINKENFKQIVKDYYPSDVSEMKKELLPLYVETYLNANVYDLHVDLAKKYDTSFSFKLYYSDDNPEIPVGRVAVVRSIGMKIEDRGIPSYKRAAFNAILIGGPDEDAYLKSLENESHTRLSADAIRDNFEKLKARNFLNSLDRKMRGHIQKMMQQQIEEKNQMDTSDLIYEMTFGFEQLVKETSQKVSLSDGTTAVFDGLDEEAPMGERKNKHPKSKIKNKKKRLRKVGKKNKTSEDVGATYILPADTASRAVVSDKEYLSIDLSDIPEAKGWNYVNISLKLINGMGQELDQAVNLKEMYQEVREQRSQSDSLKMDQEKIYKIPLVQQKLFIEAITLPSFNPNLKFIYKLEVAG